jgi:hypothetical protein
MPKKYYCDCQQKCFGVLTEVTRSVFRTHEKYRIQSDSSIPPSRRQLRTMANLDLPHVMKGSRTRVNSDTSQGHPETPPDSTQDRSMVGSKLYHLLADLHAGNF